MVAAITDDELERLIEIRSAENWEPQPGAMTALARLLIDVARPRFAHRCCNALQSSDNEASCLGVSSTQAALSTTQPCLGGPHHG